jgi:hypothetical protein
MTQGWPKEVQQLGRLKARFPDQRIERLLSPAQVWEFTAVSLDGSKVSALTVASLERKLGQRKVSGLSGTDQ